MIHSMRTLRTIAMFFGPALVVLLGTFAEAALMSYDLTGWIPAVPRGSTSMMPPPGPLRVLLNVPDPNTPTRVSSIPVDVQVEKWPKAGMPNETQQEAQLRKANAIKDAINAEFMRLMLPQRAQVDVKQCPFVVGFRTVVIRGRLVREPIIQMLTVPKISMKGLAYDPADMDLKKRTPVIGLADPTKQPASGVQGQSGQPAPTMPMGTPGSMGGKGLSSTGVDPNGMPSEVSFGFFKNEAEFAIATILPQSGQTDNAILTELADLLVNIWDVPATYESSTNTLTLDAILGPNDTFVWGNTDTGLDFEVAFPAAVPELGTLAALSIGGCPLFLLRRRRHRLDRSGRRIGAHLRTRQPANQVW